ncbi:CBS domain-containing protein [Pseudonocardia eucalypti]|uniref:CBS domain-containing protein n=1 Tax=Pseudonocardia eucalypti TaxID=648755 RepID=A0ABP9PSQ4_9PSEU|nr:CBS domain-containing protein [Pseudonocardia eucalypti]
MSEPAEQTVADLMVRQVHTVVPTTPFKEMVGTMICQDTDILPVIDLDGRPAGVVTESDLMAKLEFRAGADRPSLLAGSRGRARWHKASGVAAADVMTGPPIVIGARSGAGVAARRLAAHQVRQLCVVDDAGLLIGLLCRQHLLRPFRRGDPAIHADLWRRLAECRHLADCCDVEVADGVVTLTGAVRLRSHAEQAIREAHETAGVIAVRNRMHYDFDDYMITGM